MVLEEYSDLRRKTHSHNNQRDADIRTQPLSYARTFPEYPEESEREEEIVWLDVAGYNKIASKKLREVRLETMPLSLRDRRVFSRLLTHLYSDR